MPDIPTLNILKGSVEEMVDALGDPFSKYLTQKNLTGINQGKEGKFGGIGIQISESNKNIVVLSVFSGTPAEKAGLKPGDLIRAVNGIDSSGKAVEQISEMVRGEPGTTVILSMARGENQFDVSVVRAEIILSSVPVAKMVSGNIGYLKLDSFLHVNMMSEFKTKIEMLKFQGAQKYMLDLRDNGGGLLSNSLDLAEFFLDPGHTIVQIINRSATQIINDKVPAVYGKEPIVILFNKNSASASELFIGALAENNRAKTIGEKSFGKGSVQTIYEFTNGDGLKLTVAHFLTPQSHEIHHIGLTPQTVVQNLDSYVPLSSDDKPFAEAIAYLRLAQK